MPCPMCKEKEHPKECEVCERQFPEGTTYACVNGKHVCGTTPCMNKAMGLE